MCNAVGLVGTGPAAEAVVETLAEYANPDGSEATGDGPGIELDRRTTPALDDVDLGVVVDRVGDRTFADANRSAIEAGTPWIAVEIGGVGGYPVSTAAVTGFDPAAACFDCLASRVEANVDPASDPAGAPGPASQRVAGALAGEAVVEALDGTGDRSPLGRVTELPYAERRLLPVPGCECGEARDYALRLDAADVEVEDALANAERGLDDRVGLVRQVGEAESFPAPYYLAQACDTSGFSDATAPRQAAGVATDWNAAFMKALGESYERYAAGVYVERDTRTASVAELERAVPPSAFVSPDGPSEDEATEREWVPATTLQTGAPTHVPADLVFHPPRNRDLRPPVTTGLGLGSSGVGALLAGLYEVVERDATMIGWYSTYEPLGLTVDDPDFAALAARAASEGLSVTTSLLTQDVDVPVVAAAVHGEEWPKLALGSAAHLDPDRAARGALEEAVQNWMELRRMGPDEAAEAGGSIGAYAEAPERASELVDVDERIPAASVGPDSVPSGTAHLNAVVERVTDTGATVHAVRTTTRDLEAIGFEAVRVLVPEAQPLFLGDPFFGERAEAVPDALGFEPRLDRPQHPFP